jgi:hypothetical protein
VVGRAVALEDRRRAEAVVDRRGRRGQTGKQEKTESDRDATVRCSCPNHGFRGGNLPRPASFRYHRVSLV